MRGTNRPWMYGEDPLPGTGEQYGRDSRLCAFPGCTNLKRSSNRTMAGERHRSGGGRYCHGHKKQFQMTGEMRPIQLPVRWTPEEYDAVRVLWGKGWTKTRIATYVGLGKHVVSDILKKPYSARTFYVGS